MVIGAILFYGTKIFYKLNKKKNLKNGTTNDAEYVALVNNAMLAARTIGAILVIAGGILIIFIKK